MNKFTGILLVVCFHALFSRTALAQDRKAAIVPSPSINGFTRGEDGCALGLGLGFEYESAYEGSDEFDDEVDPAGALQWRKGNTIFYWASEALGWRGLRSDTWLFEATAGFDEGRKKQSGTQQIGKLQRSAPCGASGAATGR